VWGLNAREKWDAIRDRIVESNCDIICLQETKNKILIRPLLSSCALKALMLLNFYPQWGLLVD
jgi:hypothetical protein